MANILAPLTKKKLIENQCFTRRCYLRLLCLLPNFAQCPARMVEDAIVFLANELGSAPIGGRIVPKLVVANLILGGLSYEEWYSTQENPLPTLEFMMSSKCRFGWEEIGGIAHIGYYLTDPCECEDVFCLHGWSAQYVLCKSVAPDLRVGAEISLSDLFGPNSQSDVDDYPQSPNKEKELECKIDGQQYEIESLTDKIRQLQTLIDSSATHTRTIAREETDKMAIQNLSRLIELGNQIKLQDIQKFKNNDDDQTIMPTDSSSNLSRYENHYMEQGTIYDVQGGGKTVLALQRPNIKPQPSKSIVQGFMKTTKIVQDEQKSLSKIHPINGLANPFKSDRLNLLCHFHTAVEGVKSMDQNISYYEAIYWLSSCRTNTPSQELAQQLITRTFNIDEKRVVANPFKLPFLEIGMVLSDDSLVKCFDLLRSEYKMLWFQEMKSLKVPDFHSSYSIHSDSSLSISTRHSRRRYDFKEENRRQDKRHSTKQPTLLGIIGGR